MHAIYRVSIGDKVVLVTLSLALTLLQARIILTGITIKMKANIHPDYHEITIKLTNGEEIKTRSTYGKPGAVLQLDVDINTHPAWTGGGAGTINEKAGKVAKFNQRFAGINFDDDDS